MCPNWTQKGANMKRIANCVMSHLAEIVMLVGAAAVSVGVGMMYLPAGLIAGGALAIAGAVMSLYGAGDEK